MKSMVSYGAYYCTLLLALLTIVASLAATACGAENGSSVENVKLRISFAGGEVRVVLHDSQAGRELVDMLPLKLSFEDYARTEKIAYLPRRLSSGGFAAAPSAGDFTYYSPWGNLAVFYKGHGQAGSLYILGRIESGKELLAAIGDDFEAVIEIIE